MAGLRAEGIPLTSDAGPEVVVDRFEFRYGLAHPELPAPETLGAVAVRLVQREGVWHGAKEAEGETLVVGRIPEGSRFAADGLVAVTQAVVAWFNARGIFGVWVVYPELEGARDRVVDHRPSGDRTARLTVWVSQVVELRSLARGSRFSPAVSINNPRHRRILAGSPLRPAAAPDATGSLFRKESLEDYLHTLSMHPGRRVEASIASAGRPGKVVLDYLVTEVKPWQIFGQVSNTGTETTGRWRGRLGLQHTQLTNHDDILNVDGITTSDFDTNGAFLSYRIPLLRPATLLLRVYGSYGDFIANDVALEGLRFSGRNWLTGAELSNRTTLPGGWELISTLGANYTHYGISSRISTFTLGRGHSNFLIPFFSPVLVRDAGWWSVSGGIRIEHTISGFANEDPEDGVPALGRIGADSEWTSLRWNLAGSIFLDPLFQGGTDKAKYLANELSTRVRGRHLLRGRRLIPQEEEPIGGAFTVRGYPESVLSADEFVTASLEYAFHVPEVLKPGEPGRLFGRAFKWRPVQRQQRPDWDFVLRAFADYGYRSVGAAKGQGGPAPTAERALVDRNVSLAGAGLGAEVVLRRYFSLRCDVGMALTELRDKSRDPGKQVVVASGDLEAHVIATLTW